MMLPRLQLTLVMLCCIVILIAFIAFCIVLCTKSCLYIDHNLTGRTPVVKSCINIFLTTDQFVYNVV